MISYQAFTEEIDDIEVAVSELKEQLKDKPLLKNSCAIVFADFDVDCFKLSKALADSFDFPFIGVTDIASLDGKGYHDAIILMMILSADDCEFSVEYTDELHTIDDNKLKEAYKKATARLSEKEKVIVTLLPWSFGITYDDVVDILDVASGGVPVFGGICADGWSFNSATVFANGDCNARKGALLLISGNVNPILVRAHSAVPARNTEKTVVRASGSVLMEVSESSLDEYFTENFLLKDKERSRPLGSYLATPFIVSRKTSDGDRIELLRSLNSISEDTLYGEFVGGLRVGDKISLSYISKEQMEKSLSAVFDELFDSITKTGGYSTILCSSCGARYAMIVGDKQTEARGYMGKIPEGISLQGGYMFGEFCPVNGEETGKLYNAFNNETFAILAL